MEWSAPRLCIPAVVRAINQLTVETAQRAVETAGGQEAFDAAAGALLDDARGWRLAEMRKRPE